MILIVAAPHERSKPICSEKKSPSSAALQSHYLSVGLLYVCLEHPELSAFSHSGDVW